MSHPIPDAYRNATDRSVGAELAEHPRVRSLREHLAQRPPSGTRRSLLAQTLRLTPAIAPELHATLDRCVERLHVDTDVELYVYASPTLNAGCTAPEGDRVFVMLTSSLAEAFAPDELAFVLGHELGHHVYAHHDVPSHFLADPQLKAPADLVLRTRSWQRYAEISADRAGLICCDGLEPAARALFKLSSGLLDPPKPEQVRAYVDQAEELYAEARDADPASAVASRDWLATHPFSPVRLSAARAFVDAGMHGADVLDDVELAVHGFMALMEPSYLQDSSDEAEHLRRFVFSAGVAVARLVAPVAKEELDALTSLLGPGRMPARLDADAIAATLDDRIASVRAHTGPIRRAAALRDVARIARADGHVDPEERAFLMDLARRIQVSPMVVADVLDGEVELD